MPSYCKSCKGFYSYYPKGRIDKDHHCSPSCKTTPIANDNQTEDSSSDNDNN